MRQPNTKSRYNSIILPTEGELPRNLEPYLALTSNDFMKLVCKPLKTIHVNYFLYVKQFNDGSRIYLTNLLEWQSTYFKKHYYMENHFDNLTQKYESGVFLWSELQSQEMYVDLRKNFGVGDGITIVEVFEDCTEFFHFGAQEGSNLMNIYLNNLSILRKFIYYFKDKMNEVIDAMSDTRILLPMRARIHNDEQEMLQTMLAVFNSLTEVNRYYGVGVQSNIYLTKREMECFYWYFMGKTADEIGLILKLSKRTVETYLLNAKIKTNCYNKRQLNYKHFDSLFMAGS